MIHWKPTFSAPAAFRFAGRLARPADSSKLPGVLFTLLLAAFGLGVSLLPGLAKIGPLACALFAAAAYRNLFGYQERLRAGIRFSSGMLLRTAIVLFGLKLNIGSLAEHGIPLLLRSAGTIAAAAGMVWLLGRLFKADRAMTALLAVGTGICGAAAIAAVSPLLRSKEADTAVSAGLIALVGTGFATAYTLLQPWLPLTAQQYATWSGLSLHEIAHVAMAAAPAGQDALADGLLAKLSRVSLLVPFSLIVMFFMRRSERQKNLRKHTAGGIAPESGGESQMAAQAQPAAAAKIAFPWFLLGFVAMSVIGSFLLPEALLNSAAVTEGVPLATTLLLGMAMAGLGMSVSLRDLRLRALRPLAALVAASVLLSILTYVTV